jgi:hypothetical protein
VISDYRQMETQSMIISLHIPKTAGTSFQHLLKQEYSERLLLDYGDWVGLNSPEAIARRLERATDIRRRRDELLASYDVIHGHFLAEKYVDLFPRSDFVAFFRDPYQQTISNYHFLLRHPEAGREYPVVNAFHEAKMTLYEYVEWKEVRNPQADMLTGLSLDDVAVVGLTEEFERSIALFNCVFGARLDGGTRLNANLTRTQDLYTVPDDLKQLIDANREQDIELYRRAKERFARVTALHRV